MTRTVSSTAAHVRTPTERIRRAATSVVVFFLACQICLAAAPQAASKAIPLTSVALVADLDTAIDPGDPGTGGGFDLGVFFSTKLATAADIKGCLAPIEAAAGKWATARGLVIGLRERSADDLIIDYVKSGMPGFFTLKYHIDEKVKARARVDYVDLDGSRRAPELARDLIDTYHIAELEDALDGALKCNGKAQ